VSPDVQLQELVDAAECYMSDIFDEGLR